MDETPSGSRAAQANGQSLLDEQITYAELLDAGALDYVSEAHLRRWFGGKEVLTVGETLDVRTHIARKFWAVMRAQVLPDAVMHRLAADYAAEYLRRVEPAYVDFRTLRGLEAKRAWLDERISLGELNVAVIGAEAALVTVADFGDEQVSDCAFIVCQALAGQGEIAQRRTFYSFLARFGSRADKEWLLQLAKDRLGGTVGRVRPADRGPAAGSKPTEDRPLRLDESLPVGSVLAFAGQWPYDLKPQGWLVCDGYSEKADDYGELYAAIGFNFGAKSKTVVEFNKPELSGRFIRSTASSVAKREDRDPEWAERYALYPGGASGGKVGSYQGYGTAPPGNSFSAKFENLDIYSASDAAGCGSNPAKYHDNTVSFPLYGGDAETRPKNKYVYFIIKASAETADGSPVLPPVGAVIPFAGPQSLVPPAPETWNWCDGQIVSQIGKYARLFEATGTAHGSGNFDFEFRLPGYRGWFLRGVAQGSDVDPDRRLRVAPALGGNQADNVGSVQEWATALPFENRNVPSDSSDRLVKTSFKSLPTEDRGKYVNTLGHSLALVNRGSSDLTLGLADSGDPETRPDNLSVDFYIKIRADGDVPVGMIATIGTDLPENPFWLRCDGSSVLISEYKTLHDIIGSTYGPAEDGKFLLPDLEGRFLRGATDSVGVGSVQTCATGRPVKPFTITVNNLPTSTTPTEGGLRYEVAGISGAKTIDPWSVGGNADTRPVNLYLSSYIRAR